MTKRSEERQQFLWDIMTTALEGGVGYWSVADEIDAHRPEDVFDWHYNSYVLYCTDGGKEPVDCGNGTDDPCKGHKVTPETVAKGLGLGTLNEEKGKDIGWHYSRRKHVITANRENEAGDIDADDADCIVQLGVFGRVIFS